jgi:hypothetical protein
LAELGWAGPSGLLDASLLRPREQFSDRNPERVRKLRNVPEGHIPEASLDSAHIGAVQIRLFRQAFLRPAPGSAQFPDSLSEGADGLICDLLMLGPQSSWLKRCTLKVHSLKVTIQLCR